MDGVLKHILIFVYYGCIVTGNVDYYNDTQKIQSIIAELHGSGYVQNGTMANWHQAYIDWLKTKTAKDVGYYYYKFDWMYGELFRIFTSILNSVRLHHCM